MTVEAPARLQQAIERSLDIRSWQEFDYVTPELLDQLVEAAERRIRDALESEGYFSGRIDMRIDTAVEPRMVRASIQPGEPARIASVSIAFTGPAAEDPAIAARLEKIRADWRLPRGAVFRQEDWDRAKTGLVSDLASESFAGATLSASLARVEENLADVNVTLEVASGPPFHFGEITVLGLERYRPGAGREPRAVSARHALFRRVDAPLRAAARADRALLGRAGDVRHRPRAGRRRAGRRVRHRGIATSHRREPRLLDRHVAALRRQLQRQRLLRRGVPVPYRPAHRVAAAGPHGQRRAAARPQRLDQRIFRRRRCAPTSRTCRRTNGPSSPSDAASTNSASRHSASNGPRSGRSRAARPSTTRSRHCSAISTSGARSTTCSRRPAAGCCA